MHAHQDIATADKLTTDIQLRDGGPVTVLLDAAPQILILEHVEGGEFVRVDALQAEDLDRGARETALRRLWGAFHEQHYRRGGDGAVDGAADFGGEEPGLEEGSLD